MNDIKLCKLVTGEVVVGKEDGLVIKNVLMLMAMPDPATNQVRMSISPYWAPYTREEADIEITFCVTRTPADPELTAQYQQITSGIITAKPGDLPNLVGPGGQPISNFPG